MTVAAKTLVDCRYQHFQSTGSRGRRVTVCDQFHRRNTLSTTSGRRAAARRGSSAGRNGRIPKGEVYRFSAPGIALRKTCAGPT